MADSVSTVMESLSAPSTCFNPVIVVHYNGKPYFFEEATAKVIPFGWTCVDSATGEHHGLFLTEDIARHQFHNVPETHPIHDRCVDIIMVEAEGYVSPTLSSAKKAKAPKTPKAPKEPKEPGSAKGKEPKTSKPTYHSFVVKKLPGKGAGYDVEYKGKCTDPVSAISLLHDPISPEFTEKGQELFKTTLYPTSVGNTVTHTGRLGNALSPTVIVTDSPELFSPETYHLAEAMKEAAKLKRSAAKPVKEEKHDDFVPEGTIIFLPDTPAEPTSTSASSPKKRKREAKPPKVTVEDAGAGLEALAAAPVKTPIVGGVKKPRQRSKSPKKSATVNQPIGG